MYVPGGQAKTLMFVHVSPDAEAIGETISTLKFAERVSKNRFLQILFLGS